MLEVVAQSHEIYLSLVETRSLGPGSASTSMDFLTHAGAVQASLASTGFAVLDGCVPSAVAEACVLEGQGLRGAMKQGEISHGDSQGAQKRGRGDMIHYLKQQQQQQQQKGGGAAAGAAVSAGAQPASPQTPALAAVASAAASAAACCAASRERSSPARTWYTRERVWESSRGGVSA